MIGRSHIGDDRGRGCVDTYQFLSAISNQCGDDIIHTHTRRDARCRLRLSRKQTSVFTRSVLEALKGVTQVERKTRSFEGWWDERIQGDEGWEGEQERREGLLIGGGKREDEASQGAGLLSPQLQRTVSVQSTHISDHLGSPLFFSVAFVIIFLFVSFLWGATLLNHSIDAPCFFLSLLILMLLFPSLFLSDRIKFWI